MKKIIPFCASLAYLLGVSAGANAAIVGSLGNLALGSVTTVSRTAVGFSPFTIPPGGEAPFAPGFQDDYSFTVAAPIAGGSTAGATSQFAVLPAGDTSIIGFKVEWFEDLDGPAVNAVAGEQDPDVSLGMATEATPGGGLSFIVAGLSSTKDYFLRVTGASLTGSGFGSYDGTIIIAIPIPPAAVLFLSALAGLAGFSRIRRRRVAT